MNETPSWIPTADDIADANITRFMSELDIYDVRTFHRWSVDHYSDFWKRIIDKLGIVFKHPPEHICKIAHDIKHPQWLPDATLNIVDSCFLAPPLQTAIVYQDTDKKICRLSYQTLHEKVNSVAYHLSQLGYMPGDAIAIVMPMNWQAIAFYLGTLKMGGTVVSIADSFSSQEIATRLKITQTKLVITQEEINWDGKSIPLAEKIRHIYPDNHILSSQHWDQLLQPAPDYPSVARRPDAPCHILFSSGTTAEPKAIPWYHITPIKIASDAYFHHNIKAGDVLAWSTNLGWMMGPWLLFAAFIHRATLALYTDTPRQRAFGEFIQDSKTTMLGVVPTLVAAWRQNRCMEQLDWSAIKLLSSTGECSNAEDMHYLMALAGNKPMIEYCGGTEIGGAYISSTVIQDNYPSLFSTPAMGIDFDIIDDNGKPSQLGEVAIIPPSLGLSDALLNADHDGIYYNNMPTTAKGIPLRRHGDQIQRLKNGYYCLLGRADDTMNLGGIKTSAADIERTIAGIPHIQETAAIAVSGQNKGPSQLVIYAATKVLLDKPTIQLEMQRRISTHLNPLFKIHDLVFLDELPKTTSNKIMRRVLRTNYTATK